MENWYKTALENERIILIAREEQLLKEAGFTDILKLIPIWIVMAVMGVSDGQSAETVKNNVSTKYNLNPQQQQQLDSTLSNKDQLDKILNAINNAKGQTERAKANFDLDTLVNKVLTHEGLLPKQTPFRITNPSMRKWNDIHGFAIDKGPKPKGRENFIFLKNPEDVAKAVKKQLLNYVNHPAQFKLPANPTIGQALRKFDQSGCKGKIQFLKENIPNFNENMPLKSII